MLRINAILAIAFSYSVAAISNAAVLYVDDTAPGKIVDGTSWETAFVNLQEALKLAQPGDEIRIAQGTYTPAPPGGPRDATFNLIDGLVVQGGYAGQGAPNPDHLDPKRFPAILSGDLNGDDGPNFQNAQENSLHVVTATDLLETTELRGLVITSGNATDEIHDSGGGILAQNALLNIKDCEIVSNLARQSGAGLRSQGGLLTIERCRIAQNRIFRNFSGGGGMDASIVEMRDSIIEANGCQLGEGGGAFVGTGSRLERCVFRGNGLGTERGGGLAIHSALVIDCLFIDNHANIYGGGLKTAGDSTIVNCQFIGNRTGECGGAIYNPQVGSSLRMINSVLVGNQCLAGGGAISSAAQLTLINCSVVGNEYYEPFSGGAGVLAGADFVAYNSIFWGNIGAGTDEQQQIIAGSSPTISHCCVMGWSGALGGEGNFGDDPQFIDADGSDGIYGTDDDDLRLADASPCRDAGAAILLPNDQFDFDADGNIDELIPIDLVATRRIFNGWVDMGAFEWRHECTGDIAPSSPGVAGNNVTNVDDLLRLINSWGACDPAFGDHCVADIAPAPLGDGLVNVDDLLAIISGWGKCR